MTDQALDTLQNSIVPILLVGFLAWRFLRFRKVKSQIPELMAQGAVVVDVRSPGEFQLGSRPGSLNIPLAELNQRCVELDPHKTIILCCASGARSGMAVGILKKNGFQKVLNAGPWGNTLGGSQ